MSNCRSIFFLVVKRRNPTSEYGFQLVFAFSPFAAQRHDLGQPWAHSIHLLPFTCLKAKAIRAISGEKSAQHFHVVSSSSSPPPPFFFLQLKNKSVLIKTFILYSLLSANPA